MEKTVFSTLKKGYIPETSVFISKPFLTLFDIYFYINPIQKHLNHIWFKIIYMLIYCLKFLIISWKLLLCSLELLLVESLQIVILSAVDK